MKVKLELEFASIAELKAYIDRTTQDVPLPVPVTPPEVINPMPAPVQEPQSPPPVPATPGAPVVTAPTAPPQESAIEQPIAPTPAVSSVAASYTLDDLCRAGAQLLDQGKQADLPALLQRFGITSLPDLPKERYGEFAAQLREMGATI